MKWYDFSWEFVLEDLYIELKMNNFNCRYYYKLIRKASLILVFITFLGCVSKFHSITGQVVNEAEDGVAGVSISVCYYGWGWGVNGLVWDKTYCSEPVKSDTNGVYSIRFRGPDVMTYKVKAEDWVVTKTHRTTDSRIVVMRRDKYFKQLAIQRKRDKEKFRIKKDSENNADYYCRVVLNDSRKVNLRYKGQKLKIFQTLMPFSDQLLNIFAVQGDNERAAGFVNEIRMKIDREEIDTVIHLRTDDIACPKNTFILEIIFLDSNIEFSGEVEILVPSIKAMFDMYIWNKDKL